MDSHWHQECALESFEKAGNELSATQNQKGTTMEAHGYWVIYMMALARF